MAGDRDGLQDGGRLHAFRRLSVHAFSQHCLFLLRIKKNRIVFSVGVGSFSLGETQESGGASVNSGFLGNAADVLEEKVFKNWNFSVSELKEHYNSCCHSSYDVQNAQATGPAALHVSE